LGKNRSKGKRLFSLADEQWGKKRRFARGKGFADFNLKTYGGCRELGDIGNDKNYFKDVKEG